jgi:hypothetical protein
MSSTAEQRKQMIAAFDAGDDVRAVTIALSIAATMARSGDTSGAMAIRGEVDRQQAEAHRQTEYRRIRLDVATRLLAAGIDDWSVGDAITAADGLISANNTMPIPNEAHDAKRGG